jgi:hypothetical protein
MRQPPTLTITITEPNGQSIAFPRRGTVRPTIATEFPWFDPFHDAIRAVSLSVAGRVVAQITDPA